MQIVENKEKIEKIEKLENRDTMIVRYIRLMIGLFLCAVGIVITINANLGYSPWDVFHQGVANILHMKIGTVSIMTGFIIISISWIKGEKPGIGTILNMFLIGTFMNILMDYNIIPVFSNLYIRFLTLPIGMLTIAYGIYLYLGAGFGAGPRDGLMIILHKSTGKSIGLVRNSIEIAALIVGYMLKGPVGIGTIILSLGIGYALEFVFNILKFDTKTIVHRDLDDEMAALKRMIKSKQKDGF